MSTPLALPAWINQPPPPAEVCFYYTIYYGVCWCESEAEASYCARYPDCDGFSDVVYDFLNMPEACPECWKKAGRHCRINFVTPDGNGYSCTFSAYIPRSYFPTPFQFRHTFGRTKAFQPLHPSRDLANFVS